MTSSVAGALSQKWGSRECPGRVGFPHGSSLLPPTSLPAADHPACDLAFYLRFTLSYRDVEELLAERGLAISYETVRRWVLKFGPGFARRLRRSRQRASDCWHLDEMVVRIAGKRMYLWRAVDHEGEVLDMLVQPPPRQAGGTPADAQAAQETGLRAEITDDRQAGLLRIRFSASSPDLPS